MRAFDHVHKNKFYAQALSNCNENKLTCNQVVQHSKSTIQRGTSVTGPKDCEQWNKNRFQAIKSNFGKKDCSRFWPKSSDQFQKRWEVSRSVKNCRKKQKLQKKYDWW